jgi:hypothetical protein
MKTTKLKLMLPIVFSDPNTVCIDKALVDSSPSNLIVAEFLAQGFRRSRKNKGEFDIKIDKDE